MEKVRVIVYGVGAMGSGMVRMMLDKQWIEIVGAIGHSKTKIGKDLGEVAGVGRKLGSVISDDSVLSEVKADMVLHATSFPASDMEFQIIKAVKGKANVITLTDSRLAYPWLHWPQLARRIDEAAKENGVTVLSTGISPGFMGDLVPIMFSGLCIFVKKVLVKIVSDLSAFGIPVLNRYGISTGLEQWRKEFGRKIVTPARPLSDVADSLFRFTLIDMIADALGWQLDETSQVLEPLTAVRRKRLPQELEISPGSVYGVNQISCGIKGGDAVITIEVILGVGLEEEGLEAAGIVTLEGDQNISITIKNFDPGAGSFARCVNAIPQVMGAPAGLITNKDLPVATALS